MVDLVSIKKAKSFVRDTQWVKYAFIANTNIVGSVGGIHYYFKTKQHTSNDAKMLNQRTGGFFKFTDTTLGGNTAINVPYQFTRYADIKERRLFPKVGKGMGEWYSKTIDDWGHNVHFQVGVPAFTSVIAYAMRAIDAPTARYVATGRVPGLLNNIGKIAGFVVSVAFWEISLLSIMANAMFQLMNTRFYYLKPTMFSFWEGVQTLLNTISANLGIVMQPSSTEEATATGFSAGFYKQVREALPNTFRNPVNGHNFSNLDIGIEAHAVASRAQALQVRYQQAWEEFQEQGIGRMDPMTLYNAFASSMNAAKIGEGNIDHLSPTLTNGTLAAYMKSYVGSLRIFDPRIPESTAGQSLDEVQSYQNYDDKQYLKNTIMDYMSTSVDSAEEMFGIAGAGRDPLSNVIVAEARDGSQWFSLRVSNSMDSVSESFSNQSETSEVGSIFNKLSDTARAFWFNTAGMNTGIEMIDNAMNSVADMATGFLDGVNKTSGALNFVNPILGAIYGAKIDAPKRWRESSANMANTSFKLELRCGYGNIVSYMQDILFPLCMCLQLVLPRGTGPQSYGSPFYVKYYSKGRAQVQIGLVSSMTITRGTGNTPWSRYGLPMGVDIDFTIESMYDKMFTPSSQSISLGNVLINSIEETQMGDYTAVLSALGLNEQEYYRQRYSRRIGKLLREFDKWLSPQRYAAAAGNFIATTPILSWYADQTSVRN